MCGTSVGADRLGHKTLTEFAIHFCQSCVMRELLILPIIYLIRLLVKKLLLIQQHEHEKFARISAKKNVNVH